MLPTLQRSVECASIWAEMMVFVFLKEALKAFLFIRTYFLFLCVDIWAFVWVDVRRVHAGACRGQRSDTMAQELQVVVPCHVGSGSHTWVFCKSRNLNPWAISPAPEIICYIPRKLRWLLPASFESARGEENWNRRAQAGIQCLFLYSLFYFLLPLLIIFLSSISTPLPTMALLGDSDEYVQAFQVLLWGEYTETQEEAWLMSERSWKDFTEEVNLEPHPAGGEGGHQAGIRKGSFLWEGRQPDSLSSFWLWNGEATHWDRNAFILQVWLECLPLHHLFQSVLGYSNRTSEAGQCIKNRN